MTKPLNYTPWTLATCPQCGQDFIFPRYHGGVKKFCSPDCARAATMEREAQFRLDIKPEPKEGATSPRTCLKCNSLFPSTGKANRICKSCRENNQSLARTHSDIALTMQRRTAV